MLIITIIIIVTTIVTIMIYNNNNNDITLQIPANRADLFIVAIFINFHQSLYPPFKKCRQSLKFTVEKEMVDFIYTSDSAI